MVGSPGPGIYEFRNPMGKTSEFPWNAHAKEWLKFQAMRGLAANRLDAYGRDLDAFLAFLSPARAECQSVLRNVIGCLHPTPSSAPR